MIKFSLTINRKMLVDNRHEINVLVSTVQSRQRSEGRRLELAFAFHTKLIHPCR